MEEREETEPVAAAVYIDGRAPLTGALRLPEATGRELGWQQVRRLGLGDVWTQALAVSLVLILAMFLLNNGIELSVRRTHANLRPET